MKRFTFVLAALSLILFGFYGCKAEEKPEIELASALFTSMYTVEAEDIETFSGLEAEGERLINALTERFSGYFTPECFERFLSNRECQFFLDRVENGETSGMELVITAKNAADKDGIYLVTGTATYDKGGEEASQPFSAELRLINKGNELKVDSLTFMK